MKGKIIVLIGLMASLCVPAYSQDFSHGPSTLATPMPSPSIDAIAQQGTKAVVPAATVACDPCGGKPPSPAGFGGKTAVTWQLPWQTPFVDFHGFTEWDRHHVCPVANGGPWSLDAPLDNVWIMESRYAYPNHGNCRLIVEGIPEDNYIPHCTLYMVNRQVQAKKCRVQFFQDPVQKQTDAGACPLAIGYYTPGNPVPFYFSMTGDIKNYNWDLSIKPDLGAIAIHGGNPGVVQLDPRFLVQ